MIAVRRLLALAACCVALSAAGCGQKGPLFLPDAPPQRVPAAAQAPAAAPAATPTPTAAPAATPASAAAPADDAAARRKLPRTPDPAASQ